MKLLTTFNDNKISAKNHLIEMTIGEYILFAEDIVKKNELQRRRVKTANKSYSLLKDDIKTGCVIPPIVLAIFPSDNGNQTEINEKNLNDTILGEGKNLIILDGLQRTYTILDLIKESAGMTEILNDIKKLPLKIEIYTGISKVGVLYRMLTLNTGQTPMSTRHQVEILYSDYKNGFDGMTFISEAEERMPTGDNEFKFNEILDCFLSYITGDYFPIDTQDLVSTIKNLEILTKDDKKKDLFKELITAYNSFRIKMNSISENWEFDKESHAISKKPFAKNINELYSKVQLLAGFGAAASFLVEEGLIKDLSVLALKVEKIKSDNIHDSLNSLIQKMDEIQINAKKIGNEQRMFFYYFVRILFSEISEGHLNIDKSIDIAFKYYKGNTLK